MAVQYSFECPECQSSVELSTTQAGQEMACDGCSAVFSAPKLGDIKKLPLVGGQADSANGRISSSDKLVSPVKGWLFAGGLILAVVAGIAGYAAKDYADKLYVDVDIEKIVDSEFSAIDVAPPAEIYAITSAATEESFQLEYKEVPYRTFNIRSGVMQKVAWACWGVGGIGLLMLLSSLFMKK